MRIVQFKDGDENRRVGVVGDNGRSLDVVSGAGTVYQLAMEAVGRGIGLEALINEYGFQGETDYDAIAAEGRLLLPIDHEDPAHFFVTGTGLTHLGSARERDAMHKIEESPDEALSDSMRKFKEGLESGKPEPGDIGSQPEWFYKGDGNFLVAPGQPLIRPPFAQDGGEEGEVVGLYIIDETGSPFRVGFALGNEFSDHIMERGNYLNLGHSKLRTSSFGPELLLGNLPSKVQGTVRILRRDREIWSAEFLSGEANMCHSIGNLEHHHFKYEPFRRPGDVHCHFLGASILSYSSGLRPEPGDVFEIFSPSFGRALQNPLAFGPEQGLVKVTAL